MCGDRVCPPRHRAQTHTHTGHMPNTPNTVFGVAVKYIVVAVKYILVAVKYILVAVKYIVASRGPYLQVYSLERATDYAP